MSETLQIVIGIVLLVGVYILTQFVVGLRIKRAARGVVRDLDHLKAYDPATAAVLRPAGLPPQGAGRTGAGTDRGPDARGQVLSAQATREFELLAPGGRRAARRFGGR